MKGNLAFDFDQTLTRLPEVFGGMVSACRYGGMNVYLITGRPESERKRTEMELMKMGVDPLSFTDLIFFPETYQLSEFTEVMIRKVAKWKADLCHSMQIDVLFEDNVITVSEVKRFSPETIVNLVI